LWHAAALLPGATPADALALRWQALAFLDFALAGQPAQRDGRLLVALRRRARFDDWLSTTGSDPDALLSAWRERRLAEFGRRSAIPLMALDGLAHRCSGGAWILRGRRRVAPRPARWARTA
jgi:hypothetical protein